MEMSTEFDISPRRLPLIASTSAAGGTPMGVTPMARRITPPRMAAVNSVARKDWTL